MPKSGARTVALMTDQQTVFGYVTIPAVCPGEPALLRYNGKIYVAGPSGGGGDQDDPNSFALLVPGHPEIGDGYVRTALLEVADSDVTLL
jgi:hypothetical protein